MTSSLTASCRDELARWSPPAGRQSLLRTEFLALAERSEQPWSRETLPGHLTASAMVCTADARQVLLVLHAKVGRWLQTGGHAEPDDPSLPAAALREAIEESGITGLRLLPGIADVSVHPAPCGADLHHDVRYVVVAEEASPPVCSAESTDVRWFDVTDLPSDLEPEVAELIKVATTRLRS
ncbi:NUDIX hydrolase [Propionibacteriaceae bacterium Y1685]